LNCYGAAVFPRLLGYFHSPQPGIFSQGFRSPVFALEIERMLPVRLRLRYLTLTDGHIPLTAEQAKKASGRNHVFVGVVGNGYYHFFFRSKHQYRGKWVWLHKPGPLDLAHHFGSQPVITDIGLALREYKQDRIKANDGDIGYFRFPREYVFPGQKVPPRYSQGSVQEIAILFHAYMDAREKQGAAYNPQITHADIMMQTVREAMPHAIDSFAKLTKIMRDTNLMPDMFGLIADTTHALETEIEALKLAQHPEMKSVMARIEAKKMNAPSEPKRQRKLSSARPQRKL